MDKLEDLAWKLLRIGLLVLAAFACAGVGLITLGYDEAWILTGIRQVLRPSSAEAAVAPVLTSGGVFAVGQLAITYALGPALWAQRLFVLACTALSTIVVWVWASRHFNDTRAGAIAVSAMLATPGILILGSTAYANIPAYLMVLLALGWFFGARKSRVLRITGTGALAGLAIATRFECLAIVPGMFVLVWMLPRPERRRAVSDAILVAAVAGAVAAACVGLFSWARTASTAATEVVASTGIGTSLIDYPRLLNKWVIAETFLPFSVLVAITISALFAGRMTKASAEPMLSPWMALLPFAWFAWLFWLFRAPIPHLRYAWPALVSFMILLGFALAALHCWAQRNNARFAKLGVLAVAIALQASAMVSTFRNLVFGNGDILSWEWAGQAPRAYYTRFREIMYQRDAANYLRTHTAPNEQVLAIGLGRALGYLADREVLLPYHLRQTGQWRPERLPKRLLVEPVVGNFMFLTEDARQWLTANTELEAQFGPYAFYRLTGKYPEDPRVLEGTVRPYPGHPLAAPYVK